MTTQAILGMSITFALGILIGFRVGSVFTFVRMSRVMDVMETLAIANKAMDEAEREREAND